MKKTRVLILNPPSPDETYINRDHMGGMGQRINFGQDFKAKILSRLKSNFIHLPVVQLVYAATVLVEQGFDVKVIDALNENKSLDNMFDAMGDFYPDFIVMSISSSCLLFERDIVAKRCKELFSGVKIITVGDTLTHESDQFKQPFDVAIIGEVERVIVDICSAQKSLQELDGVIYCEQDVVVVKKEKKMLSPDELNKLALPRWDLFPYKKYVYYPLLLDAPVATLQSSRGCPYGCGYCSYPVNQGLPWRGRNAESIVAEIVRDVQVYGFRAIAFRDPLFTLDFKRIEAMCDLLIKNNVKVIFSFETRPELLTHELIDTLYAAGCRAINFGVEDIHPEILQQIHRKPISQEKIIDIIRYVEQKGIRTTCFFILGLPGSTKKTLQETLEFSRMLNPSHADYKIATPYPGTSLYGMAKANNWIIKEGYDMLGGYSATMQISEELSPEVLDQLCNDAFNKFYLRPSYIIREFKKGDIIKKAYVLLKSMITSFR